MRNRNMITAQETIDGEILVDNFAGGGGASTGIELALGKVVNIAINHDPAAILMHKTNHPFTEHYQASVWDIDPKEVCRGRPVALAWFSPDCKHFSKAKGAALVDKKIRGLAWITLRWAGTVRPRVIILENVEEFQTWGPVRKGKPVKKLAGTTFRKFISQLEGIGYAVEWRELVAADYGAPTTRKRFVLIARCDGGAIKWPTPTHAPRNSIEVKSGLLLPWRSAAEIIDWSLPCPSIFDSKADVFEKYGLKAVRPLADNTMRRVIRGVDKFTIRSGAPFIVQCNHAGGDRAQSMAETMPTVTAKHGYGVVAPSLIQYHTEQSEHVRASGLGGPIQTIDSSNRYALTSAQLAEYYTGGRALGVDGPLHTVTSHDREAVVSAHISKFYGGVIGSEMSSPMPTITSIDHNALTAAHVVKFKGDNLGSSAANPVQTVTASAGKDRACGGGTFAVCKVHLCKIWPEDNGSLGHWPEIRGLLNQHCGYTLADDEVLLLEIGQVLYYIADIGLRMLSPRELYNAMGFPPDYIIDRDYTGKPYPKNEQVARCGNAVCPPMATAVVRANFPEYAVNPKFETMAQMMDAIAV